MSTKKRDYMVFSFFATSGASEQFRHNLIIFACTVVFPLSNKPSHVSVPITKLEKFLLVGLSQL